MILFLRRVLGSFGDSGCWVRLIDEVCNWKDREGRGVVGSFF